MNSTAYFEKELNDFLRDRLINLRSVDGKSCKVHFINFFNDNVSIEQIVLELPNDKLCIIYPYLESYEDEDDPEILSRGKSRMFRVDKFNDLALLTQMAERGLLLEQELSLFHQILELQIEAKKVQAEAEKAKEEERERALYKRLKAKYDPFLANTPNRSKTR